MKNNTIKKYWKLIFSGVVALITVITITLVSIFVPVNKTAIDPEDNLLNKTIQNQQYSFQKNSHENIDLSKIAACINENEIRYMYDILNNPILNNFINWLSTQKILVVDGQIPNPKWGRVPTDNPGSLEEQILSIQQNFVLLTPQLYPILYSSPRNTMFPGFGMQFALPNNYKLMLKDYKGEIIAGKTGQNKQQDLFEAMRNSANIVIYLYPRHF